MFRFDASRGKTEPPVPFFSKERQRQKLAAVFEVPETVTTIKTLKLASNQRIEVAQTPSKSRLPIVTSCMQMQILSGSSSIEGLVAPLPPKSEKKLVARTACFQTAIKFVQGPESDYIQILLTPLKQSQPEPQIFEHEITNIELPTESEATSNICKRKRILHSENGSEVLGIRKQSGRIRF